MQVDAYFAGISWLYFIHAGLQTIRMAYYFKLKSCKHQFFLRKKENIFLQNLRHEWRFRTLTENLRDYFSYNCMTRNSLDNIYATFTKIFGTILPMYYRKVFRAINLSNIHFLRMYLYRKYRHSLL